MDQGLKVAYRSCARITRKEAKNFYFAFLTLPTHKRRAIYAVYSFFREADDIADGTASLTDKILALKGLRRRLAQAVAGTPRETADLAIADAMGHFAIDPDDITCVIDGVTSDLTTSRYSTFAELRRYCHCVASAVGLTILPILIQRSNSIGSISRVVRRHAIDLGLGMQLTNIVRDVAEDIDRDRIYIPEEELERFGVSEAELREKTMTKSIRTMLAFETERAREYLHRGVKLLPCLPRRSRGCPALLATFYLRLLGRIEARDYDVFSSRPSLSTVEKLSLTLRTLVWGKAG